MMASRPLSPSQSPFTIDQPDLVHTRFMLNNQAFKTRSYSILFLLTLLSLIIRDWKHFIRQPARIAGAIGAPLMFWLVLGSGFGKAMRPPAITADLDYSTFFLPGAVVLVVLFSSIFAAISLIQDRNSGFLDAILVTPAPRLSIVFAKIIGWSVLASLQGIALLCMGIWYSVYDAGSGFQVRWTELLGACTAVVLIAWLFSAIGFNFAWKMKSVQGFHAVMNLLLFPLWLFSGAFFPETTAANWVQAVMRGNPLSYGIDVLRWLLQPEQAPFYSMVSLNTGFLVLVTVGLGLSCIAGWRVYKS